jgi:hypothetical protein
VKEVRGGPDWRDVVRRQAREFASAGCLNYAV